MNREEPRKRRTAPKSVCTLLCALGFLLFQATAPPSVQAEDSWTALAPGLQSRPLSRSASPQPTEETPFVSLSPESTGVDFVERLDWNHPRGQLFYTGYACGGIAVGDLDGDGLPDLFFASGPNRNRLYFQRSPWKFEEAAARSGLDDDPSVWSTGATLFDVDNDGDLDLYVCNYDAPNQLYVNRGDGTFDERAAEYGLDIVDASLMASVADYDRDGDLDIYLAMNRYLDEKKFRRRDLFYWHDGMEHLRPEAEKYFTIRPYRNQPGQLNMWAGRTDRLLRNEGPGRKFTDVSDAMGLDRGDTLSATWWDYNHDGWPDLYVANDMAAPDRLFCNQQDGTFKDVALTSLPHSPWFAMGSSAGDINNDGLVDFLVADMSFRTHFKDKATMGDMTGKFRNVSVFPHQQLMRNALFVNSGTEHFQEAAYLAGLASTDWTWTAKLADFDNDGRLDAFFTNGSPVNLASTSSAEKPAYEVGLDIGSLRKRYGSQPPVLEQNLVFQNQGNLQFADHSKAWGLDQVGMSFAAVHADLDRDGDLDLVVANLDRPPSLYRNDHSAPGVLIELRGTTSNRYGVGAEVVLETSEGTQLRQSFPVAGFQSCQEAILHFGIGPAEEATQLTVRWPSGGEQVFGELRSGSIYRVDEPKLSEVVPRDKEQSQPLFTDVKNGLLAEHHEEPFDDFARQPLLPNKLSQLGPAMAWGDVDRDGDMDLYLGEGKDCMAMLYLNQGNFRFEPKPQVAFARDELCEDSAAVFFDANGDGHLDLYVGSGSVESDPGSENYRDRLYLGDSKGEFNHPADLWLPDLRYSTGAVATSDFDHDGDVDLFVGSRSIPGEYPLEPEHALLVNEGNRFTDALKPLAKDIADAGMITAAVWADIDADGWEDLLVATDWGPVRLYLNRQGQLFEATATWGLDRWSGWWQSLAAADVDGDGDIDLVAGNFGLNTKYKASHENPVLVYYGEYGDSGRKHLIEAGFEDEILFPLRGKSCSSAAMPHLAQRFPTYELFAKATLPEIYTPECLSEAQRFEVNTLVSACFLNNGNGQFEFVPLPREAQLAPVFDLAIADFNGDAVSDLFLGQNFFTPQRETGPMAGGLSVVALGKGDGTFEALPPAESGVILPGDTKAVAAADFNGDGRTDVCAATNDGPVRLLGNQVRIPVEQAPTVDAPKSSSRSEQNLTLAEQFIATQQYEQGLPYLRAVLKRHPRDVKANLMLASVRREQGRYADAQELLDRLSTFGDAETASLLLERARLAVAMEQYDRAVDILTAGLETHPGDGRLHELFGEVRIIQGLLGRAREHFRRAGVQSRLAELDERAAVARFTFERGQLAEQSGDTRGAVRLYEKSRRMDAQPRTLDALAELLKAAVDDELRDDAYADQLRIWSEELRALRAPPRNLK